MTFLNRENRFGRRVILKRLSQLALLTTGWLVGRAFPLSAMSSLIKPPVGIWEIHGDVRINKRPAQLHEIVKSGDTISTGLDSYAIFIMDKSVYMLRAESEITIETTSTGPGIENFHKLKMLFGKLMVVSDGNTRQVRTPTAVLGIRGTAIYIETESHSTYFCLCYGSAEISTLDDPIPIETIRTSHHEDPRYILTKDNQSKVIKAPMKNHTDDELIKLERIVGRIPPFVKNKKSDTGDY